VKLALADVGPAYFLCVPLLDRDGIESLRRWLGRLPGPKPRLPSATVGRRLMKLITLRPFVPDHVEPITEHLATSFISGISASRA